MPKPIPELGYHYYPDDRHFTEKDLELWLPILENLGANWLTIRTSHRRAIPEGFIRGLTAAGIHPVLHITSPLGSIQASDLEPLFRVYARWGVRHVILFDRPNLQIQWGSDGWSRKDLVERFLDLYLPILNAQQSSGLVPILPPLEPGGDYWDTSFLEGLLYAISRRSQRTLLDQLSLSMYAWTFGKALDWGAGGPARWVETHPYHTPEGSQDHLGLRIMDWYAYIAEGVTGRNSPLLVIAGGEAPIHQGSQFTAEQHAERNGSIFRILEAGELPPSLKCFCFYVLATEPTHPHASAAWFPQEQDPLPAVKQLQRLVASTKKGSRKPLRHYVLLPDPSVKDVSIDWEDLATRIRKTKPVIGFSTEEAQLAQQVTLVGGEELTSSSIEKHLREVGCMVERIAESQKPFASDEAVDLTGFMSMFVGENHA
ncbi:MAG: hypothetical protein GTO18_02815 [Anaerolineales bacterium]|nr:hypothetical protein [Anaerolineales bacterium]